MSVGPRDAIDRKLAQMYANVQTSNFDIVSKVDPEQMMKSISLLASNNKALVRIKSNINPKIA